MFSWKEVHVSKVFSYSSIIMHHIFYVTDYIIIMGLFLLCGRVNLWIERKDPSLDIWELLHKNLLKVGRDAKTSLPETKVYMLQNDSLNVKLLLGKNHIKK